MVYDAGEETVCSRAARGSLPITMSLRIALLGSRGIPARYGGYETFMEELSTRLHRLGHQVTVYCRSHYTHRHEREHQGVRLVVLPTLRTKHLDTPVHTLLSALHTFTQNYDAALVVNAANALFVPLMRLRGLPTALHVDGIEKHRAKWGLLGRAVYALSERLACFVPNLLVSDAEVIHQHYLDRYGAASELITYGVDPRPPQETGVLVKLGLEERGYFLYVSRFEPENNPHHIAEAYRSVPGDKPLVMVGSAPYASEFIASFTRDADPRVLFPGPIYGEGYRELQSQALAYIHGTEVGGTHPALVEAMGYGNCLLVNDAPENREVVGDCGLFFRAGEQQTLAEACSKVLQEPELVHSLRQAAAERAARYYSWDKVTLDYVQLFERLANGRS